MIRGIVFDCFGVLYEGSLATITRMCPPEKRDELRDINKQSDYGFIDTNQYIAGIAELFGQSYSQIEQLLREKHQRNTELVDYVRELRAEEKYHIALLSNVSSGTVEHLFGDELHELFDTVVLSYQEQLLKPNPAVFTLTATRMRLTPGECVMIDDLAENCEGAEIAGMQSIQHIANDTTRYKLTKILLQNA
ncbi:HAD family hydrolase [Candidatus Saccharibacteria bacterium]|nr:HAD family hydrolase [Candidatus Saccharibacteria bacterium]